ncbi:peroxiredoxin [Pseudomonas aeruginosa VRFPA09]|nr:peroxiredoxin [Pseudomonas aeruginosa VRFPA09]
MRVLILLLMLLLPGLSQAQPGDDLFAPRGATQTDFLPVEKAFRFTWERLDDGQVQLRWQIAPGYYLYQKRLRFDGLDPALQPQLPPGESHSDEFFGESQVYRQSLELTLPAAAAGQLRLGWQGCQLGLAFWLLGSLGLGIYERGTRLPELSLRNAAGESVQLADFRGRPLVINLWASWCPPCRREMPVLQQAQAENPDVVFLFANQGESAETVRHFLQGENLRLDNLLFDNGGQLGQQVGSVALPTTVFYTAEGRLLGSHLGELSRGSLARYLEAFEPAAAAPATRSSE